MRGASGAHVRLAPDVAFKYVMHEGHACERLRAQFEWLRDHRLMHTVRVHTWEEDDCGSGYTMERLYEWPRSTFPFRAARLTHPLRELWGRPAEVQLDEDLHREWVMEKFIHTRGALADFGFDVKELREYVMSRSGHLRRCLTHGDVTRANTLMRKGGLPILIDPIPAVPACADVYAFDVSKLVVSLLGYEHVMFGWDPPSAADHAEIGNLLLDMNYVEVCCVQYMAVVQIARMLPYHEKEVWDGLIDIARQALRIRP